MCGSLKKLYGHLILLFENMDVANLKKIYISKIDRKRGMKIKINCLFNKLNLRVQRFMDIDLFNKIIPHID